MKAVLETLLWINLSAIVVFTAIVLLKKCFGSRMSAKFHYAIWFLLVVRLLLPFNINVGLSMPDLLPEMSRTVIREATPENPKASIFEKTDADKSNKDITTDNMVNTESIEDMNPFDKHLERNSRGEVSTIHQGFGGTSVPWNIIGSFKSILSEIYIEGVLLWLWGLGILFMLGNVIRGYINLGMIKRKAVNHHDSRASYILWRCKEKLGIKGDIQLVLQNTIKTPALTAWIRPVMLLPMDIIKNCDDQELEFIIAHELNHYRRGDHLVRLLLTILKAIYWFNPMVHIGSSMMIDDMETACDAAVIEQMDIRRRKAYAQTLIGLFNTSNPIGSSSLAMSTGKSRITVEKRIRGLFMPKKTGRSVKTISLILACLLGLVCFTTACQPTPKEPVVIGKGDGKLEKIIQSKPDVKEDENRQPKITSYTDSFQGADEKVTINIDADVVVPAGNMPVIEVKPRYIDMDQVKAMAKVLFHGNPVYEPKVDFSKADLEEEILKLKKFISSEEAMLEYYGGEQTIVDEVKVEFEERIAQYEKLYDGAPDTIEIRETDWTFRPRAYYEDMVIFGTNLDEDDDESRDLKKYFYDSEMITLDSKVLDYDARMTVLNQDTTKNITHYAYFTTGSSFTGGNTPNLNETDSQPMTMAREEAISMVQDSLEKMGITNMELSNCHASSKPQPSPMLSNPGLTKEEANLAAAAGEGRDMDEGDADEKGEDVYGYHMTFTPVFEGAAVHDMTFFDHHWDAGVEQYAQTYQYEELRVTVQRETITSLDWVAPMEQVRVENENVPILSLEDATETFKKQMQLEYTIGKLSRYAPENPDYDEYISSIESGEIHITDISLGLMRMRIKDRPGAYRMAPAWVFLGYEQLYGKESYSDSGTQAPISNTPYMVINAIDGSIVDWNKGY